MFGKVKTFIKNPKVVLIKILYFISPILGDKTYLSLLFPLKVKYRLNLRDPRTYNEKLQWMKLYYRKPLMCKLVDKYEVKTYVKEKIGSQYVVTNYGVWDSFDEIDFTTLPSQFVLKTTHDQGGVVICRDKSEFNFDKAKEKLNRHLKRNFYLLLREWPYKDVKPRIIAEELLADDSEGEIDDYKFFCFNGEPKMMFISTERQAGKPKFNFYDIDFNELDIIRGAGKSNKDIMRPVNYDLMVSLARELSAGLPHVRVDFYSVREEVLFGEYTFFSGGGLKPFYPEKWDRIMGDWIQL